MGSVFETKVLWYARSERLAGKSNRSGLTWETSERVGDGDSGYGEDNVGTNVNVGKLTLDDHARLEVTAEATRGGSGGSSYECRSSAEEGGSESEEAHNAKCCLLASRVGRRREEGGGEKVADGRENERELASLLYGRSAKG